MSNLVFELSELPGQSMVVHHLSNPGQAQSRARVADAAALGSPHLALHPHPHPSRAGPGAAQLNAQLRSLSAPDHIFEARASGDAAPADEVTSPLLTRLPRLAASMGSLLQPQGDTRNDDAPDHRAFNIATSLPFLAVGASMLRRHRTPEGREYAVSMLAVGAAATLYHASSGRIRRIARKLDYWTIAAASASMVKALHPHNPWLRRSVSASLLAVPFKPFAVSAAHTFAMQAEFARQAAAHEGMRGAFKLHAAAAAAGGLAFAVEDALLDRGYGHVHGLWHLLAAAGVATTGALVEHKERLRLDGGGKPPGAGLAPLKGLRPCHDSVASFGGLSGGSPLPGSSPRSPL